MKLSPDDPEAFAGIQRLLRLAAANIGDDQAEIQHVVNELREDDRALAWFVTLSGALGAAFAWKLVRGDGGPEDEDPAESSFQAEEDMTVDAASEALLWIERGLENMLRGHAPESED